MLRTRRLQTKSNERIANSQNFLPDALNLLRLSWRFDALELGCIVKKKKKVLHLWGRVFLVLRDI